MRNYFRYSSADFVNFSSVDPYSSPTHYPPAFSNNYTNRSPNDAYLQAPPPPLSQAYPEVYQTDNTYPTLYQPQEHHETIPNRRMSQYDYDQ